MRSKAVRKIVDINLIYIASASTMTALRKKQKKHPEKKISVSKSVFKTYIGLGVLYLAIFTGTGLNVNFIANPGLFTNVLASFSIIMILQAFLGFYSVFYESKDLQAYRPLAFTESEVMIGKGISVILMISYAIFPMVAYLVILQWQLNQPLWQAIPVVLMSLFLLLSTSLGITLIAAHYVTKSAIFRKHKKVLSTTLMFVSTAGLIVALMYVNMSSNMAGKTQELAGVGIVQSAFPLYDFFFQFAAQPLTSLSSLIGWVAVVIGLCMVIKRHIVPEFYEAAVATSGAVGTVRRERPMRIGNINTEKGFFSFVWSYHIGLFGDTSVMTHAILMSSIFPYMYLLGAVIPIFTNRDKIISILSPSFLLFFILMGTVVAAMNMIYLPLTGIAISLERENFDFLKVLPFNMKRYLRTKFWVTWGVQLVLPLVVLILLLVVVGIPFYLSGTCVLAWLLVNYCMSVHSFLSDYHHMMFNWGNITELSARSGGGLAQGMKMMLMLVVSVVILLGAIGVALRLPEMLAYSIAGGVGLLIIGLTVFYRFKFKKFITHIHE